MNIKPIWEFTSLARDSYLKSTSDENQILLIGVIYSYFMNW